MKKNNKQSSIFSEPALEQLLALFSNENSFTSLSVRESTADSILICGVKKIQATTIYARRKTQKGLVSMIREICMPFVGDKAVHVHLSLIEDPGRTREEHYKLRYMLKQIRKKCKAGEPLSKEEELLYLVEELGHTEQEAKIIMAINANNNPNLLLD